MSDEAKTIGEAVEQAKRYIDELVGLAPWPAESTQRMRFQISMAKVAAYRIHEVALCYNLSDEDRNVLLVHQLARQLEHVQESYMDLLNRSPMPFIFTPGAEPKP